MNGIGQRRMRWEECCLQTVIDASSFRCHSSDCKESKQNGEHCDADGFAADDVLGENDAERDSKRHDGE